MPKSVVLKEGADYARMKVDGDSFISALEAAVGCRIHDFPPCPQLVKQELWNETDDVITRMIQNG